MRVLILIFSFFYASNVMGENSCITINNNNICFYDVTKNRKYRFKSFNKKKYMERMLLKSKEAISDSKLAVYKLEKKRKASKDIIKKWNNIVNSGLKKESSAKPLLKFLTNKLSSKAITNPSISIDRIMEYMEPNIFRIDIKKLRTEISFDISVTENYISDIWSYLKPSKNCKSSGYGAINGSQNAGGPQVFEPGAENLFIENECFTPFTSKREFSDYLNKTIEKEIMGNIANDNYLKEEAEVLLSYGKNYFLERLKKINEFASWKNEVSENITNKYKRSVYIVDSFPRDNEAPRTDNGIGNLFLLSKHYNLLIERNLIYYLMLHEAKHIHRNTQFINELVGFMFDGQLSKLVKNMCENKLLSNKSDDEICSQNSKSILLQNELNSQIEVILEHNRIDEEMIIDLTILSNLEKKKEIITLIC